MTLRRLINVAYAHIMRDRTPTEKQDLDTLINAKRLQDMTPEEQSREERRQLAMRTGAYRGQAGLIAAMGTKPK